VSDAAPRRTNVRLLACGGRGFGEAADGKDHRLTLAERHFMAATLDRVHAKRRVAWLLHGGARGADRYAGVWAAANGVLGTEYRADWARFGKRAGMLRNAEMLVKGKPDVVIAFPGGRGTAHMVLLATEAGVPVYQPPWTEPTFL
jgi:hypothetical protein